MDNKFLDKVCDQILSETRVNNDKLYTPFCPPSSPASIRVSPTSCSPLTFYFRPSRFSFHCKEVYSLKNDQEIEYVWTKYKEGVTTLMGKKELC